MPLKETIEGYSVTAFVTTGPFRDAPYAFDEARRTADLIRQHVAPHADIDRAVDIDPQVSRVCEFCGGAWTEDSKTYNGGCCAGDEEHNPDEPHASPSSPADPGRPVPPHGSGPDNQ